MLLLSSCFILCLCVHACVFQVRPIGYDGNNPTSVAEWLESLVLGDYTKSFLINGYTSMELVKKIWEIELINVSSKMLFVKPICSALLITPCIEIISITRLYLRLSRYYILCHHFRANIFAFNIQFRHSYSINTFYIMHISFHCLYEILYYHIKTNKQKFPKCANISEPG